MPPNSVLISFCGKMAAGKSTLTRSLAEQRNAVLMVQDQFLAVLYPGEILTVSDYGRCYSRLKAALTPTILAILRKETSVVLDFPAITRKQRAWFRELFEAAQVNHELHFLDVSDEICKNQLRQRSKDLLQEARGQLKLTLTQSTHTLRPLLLRKASMSSATSSEGRVAARSSWP